jgi:hypothetical protein
MDRSLFYLCAAAIVFIFFYYGSYDKNYNMKDTDIYDNVMKITITWDTPDPKLEIDYNGVSGIDCWDLDQDGLCDLNVEDKNSDKTCNDLDCRGEPIKNLIN